MGVTGPEFLRRYDTGAYDGVGVDTVTGLADVMMSVPLVRET